MKIKAATESKRLKSNSNILIELSDGSMYVSHIKLDHNFMILKNGRYACGKYNETIFSFKQLQQLKMSA
jgi:hypothetical protein